MICDYISSTKIPIQTIIFNPKIHKLYIGVESAPNKPYEGGCKNTNIFKGTKKSKNQLDSWLVTRFPPKLKGNGSNPHDTTRKMGENEWWLFKKELSFW